MTILGSRDQYCVHQSAKKFERGVNEACNLMLGGTDLTKVGKTLGKDKRNGLCFQNRSKPGLHLAQSCKSTRGKPLDSGFSV